MLLDCLKFPFLLPETELDVLLNFNISKSGTSRKKTHRSSSLKNKWELHYGIMVKTNMNYTKCYHMQNQILLIHFRNSYPEIAMLHTFLLKETRMLLKQQIFWTQVIVHHCFELIDIAKNILNFLQFILK